MIEVRYKSRIGKFSRKQENMEEAENKIKYLKQLAGVEVLGIFVNGKLVDGSKPEKKEEPKKEVWGKPPKIGGRDIRNLAGSSRSKKPDEYKIDWPRI